MEQENEKLEHDRKEAEEIVEKIKDLVKEGNVSRIMIKKNDEIILNLPLNLGIIGGIVSAAAAPWAVIIATLTTIGLDCKVEVVKKDGNVVDISAKTLGKKAADIGSVIAEEMKS